MSFFNLNLLLSIFIVSSNWVSQPAPTPLPRKKAQNIILLIGDGMGLSQISSSFYFKSEEPHFSRFRHIGFINTSSSSHKITDSAAGATAFSAGKKTYNGAIGVDSTGQRVTTILEIAEQEGLSSGVISTSSITHATPASFYAHVASRNQHEDIARELTESEVDFFAGGGKMFFMNRKDSLDYLKKLQEKGFQMNIKDLTAPEEFDIDQRYGYLLARDGMPRMNEGRGDFLPKATSMGLDHLSQNRKGFFMMIEGSQIDWGGHNNDAEKLKRLSQKGVLI
jgi:alkaline phosphatase